MMLKGILTMLSFAAALGAAAESPYGVEVVDYVTACDKKMFNNPTNVLGAPKQFVNIYSGSWSGVGYSDVYGGVVHPAVPPYGGGMHLSLVAPDDEMIAPVVVRREDAADLQRNLSVRCREAVLPCLRLAELRRQIGLIAQQRKGRRLGAAFSGAEEHHAGRRRKDQKSFPCFHVFLIHY